MVSAYDCDDTPHDDAEHLHGRHQCEHEYGDSYDDHNMYSHDSVCHVTPPAGLFKAADTKPK